MNINKTNWQRVHLGEVCSKKEENNRINIPTTLSRFVKVEHMDADSLHLKRWGQVGIDELPPTFYKTFRKGQVLYPTRNPHLRRVAFAEFDGICGEKTLTLEPNRDFIHDNFFKFLFLSHSFYSHTTRAIVGSTNPHVRWRDVCQYEFQLPPKAEQKKVAELLIAADNYIVELSNLCDTLSTFCISLVNSLIRKPDLDFQLMSEVLTYRKGLTYKSDDYSDELNGMPLINLKSIEIGGGFNKDGIKYYDGKYVDSHVIKNSDLIVACTDITRNGNVIGYPLSPGVYLDKFMLFTMDLVALQIDEKIVLRDYIYYLLKTNWAHSFFFANSSGTTVLHLNLKGALKLPIPKISIDAQLNIVEKIKEVEQQLKASIFLLDQAKQIQKQLINEILVPDGISPTGCTMGDIRHTRF